jgi:hypothetical protein
MNKVKRANKPSDASAVIELDVELDCLWLKGAKYFYNDIDMVRVMDK